MENHQDLFAYVDRSDIYSQPPKEILERQIVAAQERFSERRGQVAVLDRRARDVGIDTIKSLEDIVPLLFAHTTYKSFPQSFISDGRWDRMLKWYGTLSTEPVNDVDIAGITGIDDWVDRMWAAGHFVFATSGTSGKPSMLNNTAIDFEHRRATVCRLGWPNPIEKDNSRRMYQLIPESGPQPAIVSFRQIAEAYAKPPVNYISDETLRISQVMRTAALQRAMAEGTASAGEVAAFQAESAERAARMNDALREIVADIVEHRHERLLIAGMWAQHWAVLTIGREMGIKDGDFNPDSYMFVAGGRKSLVLPPDYEEQLSSFYGNVERSRNYGMSEICGAMMGCEAGRYHRNPWQILFVLDQSGERLLNVDDGLVDGRLGFLDLAVDGRWGGIITGDRAVVDFSATCPCGRTGPTILNPVTRYMPPGEDDKIGCAGTFDAYVRGLIS
jgi:hypothetical protein